MLRCVFIVGCLAITFVSKGYAQVSLDGTTGPVGALAGPNYQIGAELGTQAGNNLFHSFQDFSLGTGESATFSGPIEIANVVSRVTGDNPSDIDGTLRSTMPNADFYFINPNGVAFGPNATLDVQGSFHVSTADELRFNDGQVFSAANPDASGFSVAPPRAFGFFDAPAGDILVDRSTLEVGEGETLSLVGGDTTVDGGNNGTPTGGDDGLLRAEGGTINLLALGGQGEAEIGTGDIVGGAGGETTLRNQAHIDTSGDGGGLIKVRGSQLNAEGGSSLTTNNLGTADSTGGIDINTAVLRLANTKIESGTDTGSFDFGNPIVDAGDAGDISIVAQEFIGSTSVIQTDTGNQNNADGAGIVIDADTITLSRSQILTGTGIASTGNGGSILINANNMNVTGTFGGDGIVSTALSEGDAGDVVVNVGDQLTLDTGLIASRTPSASGPVVASGRGGDVTVSAASLIMQSGGAISTASAGIGGAGEVNVVADYLLMDGNGAGGEFATRISSNAGVRSTGDAGDIVITAGVIEMRGGEADNVLPRFNRGHRRSDHLHVGWPWEQRRRRHCDDHDRLTRR